MNDAKPQTIEININPADIIWETFRSSGAGGQSVNKIESAVRLKHDKSGLVIECQQERSQLLNKEKALNMLKSKLYQIEIEKKNKEKAKREDTKLKIDFGSQIRNYVLHPYKLIKDLRTNYESSNGDEDYQKPAVLYPYKLVKDIRTNIERNDVTKVLDGDIQPFIKEFLLQSQNV